MYDDLNDLDLSTISSEDKLEVNDLLHKAVELLTINKEKITISLLSIRKNIKYINEGDVSSNYIDKVT